MNVTTIEMAIARSGKTKGDLAKALGLSQGGFWKKVNGFSEFKASEIMTLTKELDLSGDEINNIFFSGCVNLIHENVNTLERT